MTPITQDESNSKTDGDQVAIPHNQVQDPPKEAVDVDSVSSPSTQAEMTILQLPQRLAENQEKYDSSSVYSSLFDEYPLLRSRPRPILFDSVSVPLSVQYPHFAHVKDTSSNTVISLSSFSPTSIPSIHTTLSSTSTIDLKPLKLGRLSQSLDASKRICQYEIPGGGVCRDDKCEDLHLNGESRKSAVGVDFRSEPDDQETATFVAAALPDSWTSVYGTTLASRIATALEETRLKNPTMTIEERVARVIAILRPSSSHSTT
ncbi:hypothetical protein K435DRAFT_431465 [Dendrothele bispora CBS 962.96]|uniref:Putative zinc-finger domain-containing protein n=1 Tax=Dendrothele bispora (strain CBS 962.96) TaxID=1314807 RepID=A0A4S8MFI4_DENBC|nr:hypothetical protein K435DRAFT_431465 [Dendrothele bispora CBS 962.96]